ncbi:MAG TPA: carbon starvation protein A, partial [Nocardioides sp.]
AIALTLATVLMFKHGLAKFAWVPGIPLIWDLIVTMTASWEKVFSDNPAIGYFAQASAAREARDAGELYGVAKTPGDVDQIIYNSTQSGILQAAFALLVIVIVAGAAVTVVKTLRAGGSLPTTEVPKVESKVVAPSDFFATKEEKEAVREWEASQKAPVS